MGLSPGNRLLGTGQELSDPKRKQSAATVTGQELPGVHRLTLVESPDPSHIRSSWPRSRLTLDHSRGLLPGQGYSWTNPSCSQSPDSRQTGPCSWVQTDLALGRAPSSCLQIPELHLCPSLCPTPHVLTPRLRPPPAAALTEAKLQNLKGDSLIGWVFCLLLVLHFPRGLRPASVRCMGETRAQVQDAEVEAGGLVTLLGPTVFLSTRCGSAHHLQQAVIPASPERKGVTAPLCGRGTWVSDRVRAARVCECVHHMIQARGPEAQSVSPLKGTDLSQVPHTHLLWGRGCLALVGCLRGWGGDAVRVPPGLGSPGPQEGREGQPGLCGPCSHQLSSLGLWGLGWES